jgi:hypothetical protein
MNFAWKSCPIGKVLILTYVPERELVFDNGLISIRCMGISDAVDGFESDSEREESSEEEDDENLKQSQRTAKPISRHSTRRSSQQQQMSENKGNHLTYKH